MRSFSNTGVHIKLKHFPFSENVTSCDDMNAATCSYVFRNATNTPNVTGMSATPLFVLWDFIVVPSFEQLCPFLDPPSPTLHLSFTPANFQLLCFLFRFFFFLFFPAIAAGVWCSKCSVKIIH